MKLFIVVPVYNEEEIIENTIEILKLKLSELILSEQIDNSSRILLVDDGSADDSWGAISNAGVLDKKIQGIRFSRNEGHQNALMAGITYAYGQNADAVITIDADLQQDINAIDNFIIKFKTGADVVYGIRNSRKTDEIFKRFTANCFYKIMGILGTRVIKNHADYRLLSRKAMEALLEYRETQLFLRGIVASIGLVEEKVYFDVKDRSGGESKYTISKMVSLALNGITSFSIHPMHLFFT